MMGGGIGGGSKRVGGWGGGPGLGLWLWGYGDGNRSCWGVGIREYN